MGVHSTPTIYKNGLNENDIAKLLSNSWVDISNKIGSFSSSIQNGNFVAKYSYELGLIFINMYCVLTSETTLSSPSILNIYNFNTTLPGDNDNRLFVGEMPAIAYSNNDNIAQPILCVARPYTTPDPTVANKLYAMPQRGQIVKTLQISGFNLVTSINAGLNQQFKDWIDNH